MPRPELSTATGSAPCDRQYMASGSESVRTAFSNSVAPSHSWFLQSTLAPCFMAICMPSTGDLLSFCSSAELAAFGSSSLRITSCVLIRSSEPPAKVHRRREAIIACCSFSSAFLSSALGEATLVGGASLVRAASAPAGGNCSAAGARSMLRTPSVGTDCDLFMPLSRPPELLERKSEKPWLPPWAVRRMVGSGAERPEDRVCPSRLPAVLARVLVPSISALMA
mmetsp:Transcript_108231/g.316551  ORF Transcript_108231/g.316551 Transcript_108231/m.316551 type:complete len:224 (+) Transcript_108231:600-1271(+)